MSPLLTSRMIVYVWAGMVIGISFVATPLKFLVPQISQIDALALGQLTFRVFLVLEAILLGALALSMWRTPVASAMLAPFLVLSAIFLIQKALVFPILDMRLTAKLGGIYVAAAYWHHLYVVLEIGLLACLLIAPTWANRRANAVYLGRPAVQP